MTFAFVTLFEYFYPITVFCYYANLEVNDDFTDYAIFARFPAQIGLNIIKKLGSIMFNLMTAPDCVMILDGYCAGTKIGLAGYYIADLSSF